jgi:hypothetical protein
LGRGDVAIRMYLPVSTALINYLTLTLYHYILVN